MLPHCRHSGENERSRSSSAGDDRGEPDAKRKASGKWSEAAMQREPEGGRSPVPGAVF
jgi:hypothetical protein